MTEQTCASERHSCPRLASTQVRAPGAPRGSRKDNSARAKDFLEEGYDFDVLGASTGKNPGGRGTKKTCRVCQKAGWPRQTHRSDKCPWMEWYPSGETAEPKTNEPPPDEEIEEIEGITSHHQACELCAEKGWPNEQHASTECPWAYNQEESREAGWGEAGGRKAGGTFQDRTGGDTHVEDLEVLQ